MDVTGPETDWRSTNFRQKLVSQIDEAMRKAGVAHNKSSKEMESHVFMKAKTREEYLSLVARLIIHFRDIHPMNALQNLTGGPPAGAPGMGMASRAQGAPMAGMGGLGPMGQQMSLPGQQQPPGTSGMAPHGMPGVSTATQQTQLQLQQIAQQQQQQQQQFQQQQVALQQQQFQAQQSAMQQQFQVQQQQAAAAAAAQQQQQQQQQLQAVQQQQQHMLKLQMQQQQNQQQVMTDKNYNGNRECCSALSFIIHVTCSCYFLAGNPNSVMSPASSSQSEEQQYLEKLKQLSKYIEPLRRMINKIDKNEDRKKDLSKMKSLLDILTDPSKRCPLKTLQKCEIALEKLKNDMAVPTPPPPPVPPTKQQYLCQPLLDAVLANIRSPVFNHSLYRTFMPAMTAIHGPPITAPVVSPRKRKYEEDERQTIPNVLQGEVARLNPKFLVNLDPSHCSNNGTVHLICKLDDKNLPNVPPLQLSVPADYPDQSPLWIKNPRQYAANPFLQSVYRYMTSKLLQLPDKHSVTALLNTWAQSIRQACLSAA
uniref:Mediator of RNA polymerase II transcription subunit 15 n=1 Tax=Anas zonorhyncha TaxID=75864 RepID=A0A8B9W455_9AVES